MSDHNENSKLFWAHVYRADLFPFQERTQIRGSGRAVYFLLSRSPRECFALIILPNQGKLEDIAVTVGHSANCTCDRLLKPQDSRAAAEMLRRRHPTHVDVDFVTRHPIFSMSPRFQMQILLDAEFQGVMTAWATVLSLIRTFKEAMNLDVPQAVPRLDIDVRSDPFTGEQLTLEPRFWGLRDLCPENEDRCGWHTNWVRIIDTVPRPFSFYISPGPRGPVLVVDSSAAQYNERMRRLSMRPYRNLNRETLGLR